jgi:hypothetical protein
MTLHASSGNNDYFYEHILLAEEGQDLSLENVFPKYGVSLIMQETSHDELRDLNNDCLQTLISSITGPMKAQ